MAMSDKSMTKALDRISLELDGACIAWKLFHQCFCHSEERSKFLFDKINGFIACIHDALLHEVVLGTMRLLDAEKTDLSLHRVVDMFRRNGLSSEAQRFLEDLRNKAYPLRQFRNKRIAHLDRKPALDEYVLEGFGIELVEEVLAAMEEFLGKARNRLEGTSIARQWRNPYCIGDAEELLAHLERSDALERLVKEGVVSFQDARRAGAYGGRDGQGA